MLGHLNRFERVSLSKLNKLTTLYEQYNYADAV